jgi:hypothetical protein
LLTWLGACAAESPFTEVSQVCAVLYFLLVTVIALWSHVVTFLYLNSSHYSTNSVVTNPVVYIG